MTRRAVDEVESNFESVPLYQLLIDSPIDIFEFSRANYEDLKRRVDIIPNQLSILHENFYETNDRRASKIEHGEQSSHGVDQIDDDDALSKVFFELPSSINDSINSSTHNKYNDVVKHIVEIFCAEENLSLIYREAVQNYTADKFRHNHNQLLKLYFKQLRHEIRTRTEMDIIRLLRTKFCRNKVTFLVLKFLQPFEVSDESRLTTSALAQRKPERNYNQNQVLEAIVVEPESSNDHGKQHGDIDDHENVASKSSEPSIESENEPLIENHQSPLQAIDDFLIGGKTFTHLKVNLDCLLHPPQSLKDALSSESIFVIKQYISRNLGHMAYNDAEKILELRTEGRSYAKIAKFLLKESLTSSITFVEENVTFAIEDDILNAGGDELKDEVASDDGQTSISETALKPLIHDKPRLVTWSCSCDMQLYDHYTEIVSGSLEQLQQRLRQENTSPSRSWQTFWNELIA